MDKHEDKNRIYKVKNDGQKEEEQDKRQVTKEMVCTSIALSVWKILKLMKKVQNIPLMEKKSFQLLLLSVVGFFFLLLLIQKLLD